MAEKSRKSGKSSGSSKKKSSGSKQQKGNRKKKVSEAKIMGVGTLFILAVAFLYRAAGCGIEFSGISITDEESGSAGDITSIHYLDVGQGDSALICGSEKTILIDGGDREYGNTVIADLKEYGVENIDCIIGTHPHADHIGGLADVLLYAAENDDLTIGEVIIPDIPEEDIPTSYTYQKFLDGIEKNNIDITFAEYKMTIDIGSGIMTLYPPVEGENYSSLNDYSVCVYLECGETSFFFTGDMEKNEELDMLEAGYLDDVKADVLKAGHHGSSTSSSEELLEQINPDYVVISCGAGNSYGHPHEEALQRFNEYADKIYRTDTDGTITCITDGKNLEWSVKGS